MPGGDSQLSVIHAPQGRVPVALSSLAPPPISRPTSKSDFVRGFGLDVPEEDEEAEAAAEAEAAQEAAMRAESELDADSQPDIDADVDAATDIVDPAEEFLDGQTDGIRTAGQSRHHSRHVSKLSAALSLHAVGGLQEGGFLAQQNELVTDKVEEDEMNEWTGSEDFRLDETSDDEVCTFF
jgi:hypothetical protein